MHTNRRDFLERLGAVSATAIGMSALAFDTAEAMGPESAETWDMSWLDRLRSKQYKAVIDANVLEEGYAPDLASGLIGDYKDAQNVAEDQVGIVIVARRGGTPLVLGDAIWDKYALGVETKMNDGSGAPFRRNPFYRAKEGASAQSAQTKLENLQKRGVILIVCNIAATNWSRSLATKTNRPVDEVKADVYANFVPGTIVMPSGVFALMRAQNAGCAYMRGQ